MVGLIELTDRAALVAALVCTGVAYVIVRLLIRESGRTGEDGAGRYEGHGDRSVLPLCRPSALRRFMSMILSKEYTVDELRAQAADALGVDPGITLRLAPDVTITIPHPMFVDDDVLEGMNSLGQGGSPIEIAKLLLGDDFEILRSYGGRSTDVTAAWTIMNKQMQDTMPGSGNPTR